MDRPVDKNEHFGIFCFFRLIEVPKREKHPERFVEVEVHGEEATPIKTDQNWFKRFQDLKYMPRTGLRGHFDEERPNELIHEGPRQTKGDWQR
ncbi:hypothetical protein RB195_017886 [Necator americanus]|uniref:Mos1 transposase HTH domain-containing protein n=1 Tax=Necator americanus TaxID=51031 RepID=A0ABR1CA64_NECAM